MSSNLDYLNRVYLKIDLDKICNNTKEVIKKVGKDTKVMAVVKADAYGHGAIEVAKALSEIGTYGFAVATVGEALALRRAGITKPILILDFVFPNQFDKAFQINLRCLSVVQFFLQLGNASFADSLFIIILRHQTLILSFGDFS